MRVLMLAPAFPSEMPYFARGLASVGAHVVGVGDQPVAALPPMTREALGDYIQVPSLFDDSAIVAQIRRYAERVPIERVETLWEPLILLAAQIREALGLAGMSVEQALAFRDKERMKQVLEEAGLRVPRHARESTAGGIHAAAERIGFPLIIKPIAGAGSADTYKIADRAELDAVLPALRHVPTVSVEEYIEGEEYTFDTICAGGEIALLQHLLVPAQAAHRAHRRVDQPADGDAARRRGPRPGGRAQARPGRDRGSGLPPRLHPHGVVPDAEGRGGLRRDRRSPTGSSVGRDHELRL